MKTNRKSHAYCILRRATAFGCWALSNEVTHVEPSKLKFLIDISLSCFWVCVEPEAAKERVRKQAARAGQRRQLEMVAN
jgi:hypothetical protein